MTTPASRKKRALATYLTVAFASLLGVLTILLVGVIGVTAGDQVQRDIGSNLAELARQTSDKLDRGMFERYREVRLIARRYDLQDHAPTRRFLAEMQESYPYYAWIGVTDLSGKVVTATNGVIEKANVGARPWFRNAFKGQYIHDVHDAVLLAKLLPNPHPEPLRFVDVAYPYVDKDGKVAGVLGAHLSWQWAREVARSIIKPRPGLENVQAFIIDKDGKVVLGPPDLERRPLATTSVRAGGSGSVVETWPDGRRYLVGYASSEGHGDYPGLGWKILVRQDIDSAFAPVELLQRKVLLWGLAIGLVFSLFGVLAARRISAPLRSVSEAADRVGRGEAVEMPPYAGGLREVSTLSDSLARTLATLVQKEAAVMELNATLEKRVAARTAELGNALDQVRASQARIEAILETSHDAFVGIDLAGRITDWNSSAELLFGLAKQDAVGMDAADLIVPARLRARFRRRLAEVDVSGAESLSGRMELTFQDSRGREFPVETSVSLTGENDGAFFSAFLHDISERKQVERMKNEFISTTSHELRTPLTAIRFSLGLLADGSMGELEPGVKKLILIANDSCERLVRLINDMLDIEKIESGQMPYHFAPQSLAALVREAVEATGAYAAQYGIELVQDAQADPQVLIDRDRMMQVVVNLLSNAVKFSRPGTVVEIRVLATAELAKLQVVDHGEGIPMEFRPRIFGKFAQADGSNTRTRSGTGLGLSICKQLVEAHKGRIGFDSSVGVGTTFEVLLPLA